MFANAVLLLAHTVSAMRHMLKICDLYAVDYDVKFNSNKLCGRPTLCHRPLQVDLWPFNLESGVRITCYAGYLCANFRPLCSRLTPNVRDRQTNRQTYVHHCLMTLP